MVDIHSHILPGLDDGARTVEESLAMVEIAAKSGTTDIVATPHSNGEFPFEPERLSEAFRDLSEKARGVIRLHLGCDFHLHYDNLRDALDHPTKYTINGHQYLMVELPDLIALSAARQALQQLIHSRIVPIITHPERNLSLQTKLGELRAWVADGCLLQVTAQSITGDFGSEAERAALWLMNAKLVHFVASDAHDPVHRPPDLAPGFRLISKRYGAARAHALFISNPAATLVGERIVPLTGQQNRFWRFLQGKG